MALNNEIKLEGNIGNEPEARATKAGTPVTHFRLAVDNYAGKDETGKVKEETMWVDVVTWSNLAETVAKTLKKGDLVKVVGRLNIRKYTDKNNTNREAVEVIAQHVTKIDLQAKQHADQAA